jgi:hypothetical protein
MNDQPSAEPYVGEDSDSDRWLQWPCCPECGTRRQTFCRTCDLAGDDFGLAEFIPSSEPIGVPATDGDISSRSDSPNACCGSSSCQSAGTEPDGGEDGEGRQELPVLLFCPDCSEAFSPSFFRLCAQCGHDFGEGRVVPEPRLNEINNRVLFAILVLVGLGIGSVVYFWMLFQ